MARRIVPVLFALALAACGKEAIEERIELQPFASCGDMEKYLQDTAVRQLRSDMQKSTSNTRGWAPLGAAQEDMAAAPNDGTGGGSGPTSFTKTNSQVEGVDEADFVKTDTDGKRIYFLTGRRLVVLKSWPPAETSIVCSTTVEGWPSEMFVADTSAGKRVVVFSGTTRKVVVNALASETPPDPGSDPGQADTTKVSLLDVTCAQGAAPELVGAWYLPGRYSTSRLVGTAVRIVLEGDLVWPDIDGQDADGTSWLSSLTEDSRRRNKAEQVYRARKLEEWIPAAYVRKGGAYAASAVDCASYYRPNAPVRLGLATVASLDLEAPAGAIASTTVLANVGRVYSSGASLYIASPHWWFSLAEGQMDYTYLHKFDLSRTDRVAYVASGGVPGSIVNQFSMDEHEGYLRIATTGMQGSSLLEEPQAQNRVWVLREEAGRLAIAGRTDPVATGEMMFAARFFGNRGFLVTYRRIDPLFTVDLTDPTGPRIVGMLEVPGFSSYIHMIDDGHLLTIGSDDRGSAKLEVFDVSDMAAPRSLVSRALGSTGGTSEAQSEHKAFNWFPERRLLAVPFTAWGWRGSGDYWDSYRSDLLVFRVSADGRTIEPRGTVDHDNFYRTRNVQSWDWSYQPGIRRSVMAGDDAADFVYSFSDAGLKVHDLADLAGAPKQQVAW